MITLQYARDALTYDHVSGIFYWRHDRPRSHFKTDSSYATYLSRDAGNATGFPYKSDIYRSIAIGRTSILAHRLAYAMYHGIEIIDLPVEIDHVDLNKKNNAISNLRPATHSGNMQNKGLQSNNTSGFKGVYWHKSSKRWAAKVKVGGRQVHIGYFSNPQDAHMARIEAANDLHGEYARHAKREEPLKIGEAS